MDTLATLPQARPPMPAWTQILGACISGAGRAALPTPSLEALFGAGSGEPVLPGLYRGGMALAAAAATVRILRHPARRADAPAGPDPRGWPPSMAICAAGLGVLLVVEWAPAALVAACGDATSDDALTRAVRLGTYAWVAFADYTRVRDCLMQRQSFQQMRDDLLPAHPRRSPRPAPRHPVGLTPSGAERAEVAPMRSVGVAEASGSDAAGAAPPGSNGPRGK